MSRTPPDDEDDDATRQRRNLIVLGVAILIVVVGWLVVHEMVRLTRLQDCVLAGHHDCDQSAAR